jgi:hypothetical protein
MFQVVITTTNNLWTEQGSFQRELDRLDMVTYRLQLIRRF